MVKRSAIELEDMDSIDVTQLLVGEIDSTLASNSRRVERLC